MLVSNHNSNVVIMTSLGQHETAVERVDKCSLSLRDLYKVKYFADSERAGRVGTMKQPCRPTFTLHLCTRTYTRSLFTHAITVDMAHWLTSGCQFDSNQPYCNQGRSKPGDPEICPASHPSHHQSDVCDFYKSVRKY